MTTTKAPAKLRRELSIWEAIGISLALMAPSMAANINPQGIVPSVGRAVPLAFVLATVGVLLVAYTFVRLTRKFNHAGSVYGFVGATLGPRAGVLAGWALAGTYMFYGVVTSMAFGRFAAGLIASWSGSDANDNLAFTLGVVALIPMILLALWPAKYGTRVLLSIESVTVGLILIVTVLVLVHLLGSSGPGHLGVDMSVFKVPSGTPTSELFLGVVFGFLSFAGFEAAATLGEETREPRKQIPRAILGVAIFGGVYFVFVTAVTVMGFGTSDKGLTNFTGSSALVADLGASYVTPWVGDLISIGAMVSAFACMLACCVGSSRLMYALSRDGVGFRALDKVHSGRGTPTNATFAVSLSMLLLLIVGIVALRGGNLNNWIEATGATGATSTLAIFSMSGTIGTLILLVVYILATIGVMRLSRTDSRVSAWDIIIPVLAIIVLGYTLIRNIYPWPTGAGWWAPLITILWLVIGLVWIAVRNRQTVEAGRKLLADEGLAATEPTASSASRAPVT
ncbi:MAG: APC family permease [Candidatus Nanopelagicales bacterium]